MDKPCKFYATWWQISGAKGNELAQSTHRRRGMVQDYFIPIEIQGQLQNRADLLKHKVLPRVSWRFIADARGKFIYLRRLQNDGQYYNLGRLTYGGDTESMSFAIFRYSTEKYDAKADFHGAHHLDGTIEGALKALIEAYP